jgi:hypothetical protein
MPDAMLDDMLNRLLTTYQHYKEMLHMLPETVKEQPSQQDDQNTANEADASQNVDRDFCQRWINNMLSAQKHNPKLTELAINNDTPELVNFLQQTLTKRSLNKRMINTILPMKQGDDPVDDAAKKQAANCQRLLQLLNQELVDSMLLLKRYQDTLRRERISDARITSIKPSDKKSPAKPGTQEYGLDYSQMQLDNMQHKKSIPGVQEFQGFDLENNTYELTTYSGNFTINLTKSDKQIISRSVPWEDRTVNTRCAEIRLLISQGCTTIESKDKKEAWLGARPKDVKNNIRQNLLAQINTQYNIYALENMPSPQEMSTYNNCYIMCNKKLHYVYQNQKDPHEYDTLEIHPKCMPSLSLDAGKVGIFKTFTNKASQVFTHKPDPRVLGFAKTKEFTKFNKAVVIAQVNNALQTSRIKLDDKKENLVLTIQDQEYKVKLDKANKETIMDCIAIIADTAQTVTLASSSDKHPLQLDIGPGSISAAMSKASQSLAATPTILQNKVRSAESKKFAAAQTLAKFLGEQQFQLELPNNGNNLVNIFPGLLLDLETPPKFRCQSDAKVKFTLDDLGSWGKKFGQDFQKEFTKLIGAIHSANRESPIAMNYEDAQQEEVIGKIESNFAPDDVITLKKLEGQANDQLHDNPKLGTIETTPQGINGTIEATTQGSNGTITTAEDDNDDQNPSLGM